MDGYKLLNNIQINFNKLFSNCVDGITYTPLKFEVSSDIDSLLVLYQLTDVICYIKQHKDVSTNLLHRVLYQIITIKCKEFVDTKSWNSNYNNFVASFEEYLNKLTDELLLQQ